MARLSSVLICLTLLGCLNGASANAAVPAGFEDTLVTQVSGPTALAFTPDQRMLITSHFGPLRVYQNGALVGTPAIDLASKLCSDKERGLLGVAVDPAFATNRYIYLYYTFKKFGSCPYNTSQSPVNRVSRFELPANNVIDPATERVLIDNMPSPDGIHNAGDLHFGKDGFLYVTVGDGGCDYAGNSGCGSQNDASRDSHVLLGKVLRITRDGDIPATNPFQGVDSARCNITGRTTAGNRCQETYASGLRNPFRFAFDPNASGTRFFVNDTGQSTWEEVNLGQAGADYGWNVREGHCATGSTTNCGPPPAGVTNPIHDYAHSSGCTAITGGAFVPNGIWPTAYDGAYLYGDFTCGKIIRLTPSGGSYTTTDFVTGLGNQSAVVLAFGPHGATQALYYTTYNLGGQIRRVAFTGSANRSPVAVASANPTSGTVPLNVSFDGQASSDPDRDPLTYEWDFGDGSPLGSGAQTTHAYTTAGVYTTTLRVRDNRGGLGTSTVRIDAGNTAPTPTIESPAASARFRVGEQITLRGSATDSEEGALPASALSWRVIKHHDTHTHPFLGPVTGNDVPLTAPSPEDLAATATSYLEIQLTATDSSGLSRTVSQDLRPRTVTVRFQTKPDGLDLEVNATTITTPVNLTSWEGYDLNVKALDQIDTSGRGWAFSRWSDGGAAQHTITTSASPASYSAIFRHDDSTAKNSSFLPDADARVEEANPTANFGLSDYLRVDAGAEPDVESYLRFNVSGVSGTVTSAKLRLFAYSGTADGPAVYGTSNGWTESGTGGITWNSRPPPTTGARDDKGAIADNSTVEYDVTPLVTGNGTYSFLLRGTSTDGVYFYSRSGAVKPELVLTVAPSSSLLPDADARVEEANPTVNFGLSDYLRVDAGAEPDVESYLRFNVSGVSGTVTSAKLRLFAYSGTANGPAAYGTSNGWTESGTGGITWNSRPPPTTGALDDKGAIADNSTVEYDVTPLVTGNGTYSVLLRGTSSDGVYFYSRSGAVKPELIVAGG